LTDNQINDIAISIKNIYAAVHYLQANSEPCILDGVWHPEWRRQIPVSRAYEKSLLWRRKVNDIKPAFIFLHGGQVS
jgi:hypothetical protein